MLLSGCASNQQKVIKHNYLFQGESEHWLAEYKIDAQDIFTNTEDKTEHESLYKKLFKITYKGELSELHSMNSLTYSIEGTGKRASELTFDKPPQTKTFIDSFGGNGSAFERSKEEEITVNVTWDGDTGGSETFLLKYSE